MKELRYTVTMINKSTRRRQMTVARNRLLLTVLLLYSCCCVILFVECFIISQGRTTSNIVRMRYNTPTIVVGPYRVLMTMATNSKQRTVSRSVQQQLLLLLLPVIDKSISTSTTLNHQFHDDDDDNTTTTTAATVDIQHYWNRRTFVISSLSTIFVLQQQQQIPTQAMTTATTIPTTASSSTIIDNKNNNNKRIIDPLLNIQLGKGQWTSSYTTADNDHSSCWNNNDDDNNNERICYYYYPDIFCTYATRFLIRYDTNVNMWWTNSIQQQQILLSLKKMDPNNDDSNNNNKSAITNAMNQLFATFAKSVQYALNDNYNNNNIPPSILYEHFLHTYAKMKPNSQNTSSNNNNRMGQDDDDVYRQIAILFTLLPPQQQPIEELNQYYNQQQQGQGQKDDEILTSSFLYKSEISPSTITTDVQLMVPELLSDVYSIRKVHTTTSTSTTMNSKINIDSQLDAQYTYYTIYPPLPSLYNNDNVVVTKATNLIYNNEKNDISAIHDMIHNTIFGPLSMQQPLSRDSYYTPRYSINTFMKLGLAGAICCALTHAIVIPLDVVKTRAQTDLTVSNEDSPMNDQIGSDQQPPGVVRIQNDGSATTANVGMIQMSRNLIEREGIQALLLGAQATVVGYMWYGVSLYPSYTFLKQYLSYDIFSMSYSMTHTNEISLLAGAGAAVIASIGLAPIEAARIRVVANPSIYRSMGLLGTLNVIATENPTLGWMNLYTSLPSLLVRQVTFGSVKFLIFERTCESIYTIVPMLHDQTWTSLFVSLLAGGFAGIISSIVSQPADSILTYIAKDKRSNNNNNNIVDIINRMVVSSSEEEKTRYGSGSSNTSLNKIKMYTTVLFRGLKSRCIWAGSTIAGQFLLYDTIRAWLHVNPNDLIQYYTITIQ